MEVIKVFEEKFQILVENKIKSVLLESNECEATEEPKSYLNLVKTLEKTSLACSYCRIQFDSLAQQREHYKLDWHRYNLRQSLGQKQPITEEQFLEKNSKDDISSISGSDTEKEDTLDTFATAQGKIFLQNSHGMVFSMYACLLFEKKEDLSIVDLSARIHALSHTDQWAVLMLGGGHFAAAIFHRSQPILHKTFHCYTVRAGQGSTQSTRDKSSTSHPKSAGASLRRYNESALAQHVHDILGAWSAQLERCGLIFYRAAGPHNRAVLFGDHAPFKKGDSRLRSVPFSTRRATFKEVERVFEVLMGVRVYQSLEAAVEGFRQKRKGEGRIKVDRAKSRERMERALPVDVGAESSSEEEVGEFFDFSSENQEISFQEELEEFTDSLSVEERQKRKRKPKKSKARILKEQEGARKKELIDIVVTGRTDKLSQLLDDFLKIEGNKMENFSNEVLDEEENTLLHLAAMNEQNDTLLFLLQSDGNPCSKNSKQQTPYTSTQSREIRETLKQFARDFPEKFNYNKANIPTNVLTPEELGEKRKNQRQVKKEKEKIKKKENWEKRQEDQEKERFLKLSDREKRALAAERRILNQSGSVTVRCFLCAADMAGKTPFEYSNNRFCSVECLKAHRMQNPVVLS